MSLKILNSCFFFVGAAWQVAALPAGHRRPVDLRDTMIAGFALARGARLATRNTRHFDDTTIGLINPFAP